MSVLPKVVLQCCSAPSSVEVVESLLCKLQEMTISEETFLMLLCEVKDSSSDLLQLLQALKDARGMNSKTWQQYLICFITQQIPLSNTSDDIFFVRWHNRRQQWDGFVENLSEQTPRAESGPPAYRTEP